MTARQYLKQVSKAKRQIVALEYEIEEWRTRLTSTTVTLKRDRVKSSPKADRFADLMAALVDKELYYQSLLYAYMKLRSDIVKQIWPMEPALYAELLYKLYVEEKSLRRASRELHYDYTYLCRVHGAALRAFEKTYLEPHEDNISQL